MIKRNRGLGKIGNKLKIKQKVVRKLLDLYHIITRFIFMIWTRMITQ